MKAIYKPKGKAAEYGEYAVNLYSGCVHGCKYCYVPGLLRISREEFRSGFKLRPGILEQLEKDAAKHPKDKPVFLSFTSDPYQPGNDLPTREALEILNKHEIPFIILTKGPSRAIRDFELYKPGDMYGVSLVCDDSTIQEPGAGLTKQRLISLSIARDMGISTWVSFEPVIDPRDTLFLLTMVLQNKLADFVKVGACSGGHSKIKTKAEWFKFSNTVERIASYYSDTQVILKQELIDLAEERR